MITAQDIYNKSLAILGESTDAAARDTAAFRQQAPHFINLLLCQLHELDQCLKGNKPAITQSIPQITDLTDTIDIAPPIALSLMPIGLAYYLILEEDANRALFFYSVFKDEKASMRDAYKVSRRGSVTSIY